MADCFGAEDNEKELTVFPLSFETIKTEQTKDTNLQKQLQHNQQYQIKAFHGGGKTLFSLICRNNKIFIPEKLRIPTVEWYHNILCHPGQTRTEETIRQHFYWPNLDKDVKKVCAHCGTC